MGCERADGASNWAPGDEADELARSRRSYLRTVAAVSGLGLALSGTNIGDARVVGRATATPDRGDWPWYRGGGGLRGYAAWADVPDSRPDVGWVNEDEWRVLRPALVDGTVLWTDWRGTVTRADARTGEVAWSVDVVPDAGYASARPPAVADGAVYVPLSVGTGDETYELHARSLADGTEQWAATLDSDPNAVAVGGGRALVSTGSSLTALDVADGSVTWTVPERFSGPVPVSDGTAYVVRDAGLAAVDAATGTETWRNGDIYPEPVVTVAGDELVATTRDRLVVLDSEFGTVSRERSLGPLNRSYGPAVTDDAILLAGGGTLGAFERDDLSERWRTTVDAEVTTPAITDGDAVLWGTGDGRLLAYGVAEGQRRWVREFGFEFDRVRTPALGNGAVFVGGGDYMYALGAHEVVPTPATTDGPRGATETTTETAASGGSTTTGPATRTSTTETRTAAGSGDGTTGSGLPVSPGLLVAGAAGALGLGSVGVLALGNRGGSGESDDSSGDDRSSGPAAGGGPSAGSGSGGSVESGPAPTPNSGATSGGDGESVRAHSAVADPVGETIGGYELEALIGSGGNANAYRAVDEAGVDAAVKLPRIAPEETVDRSVFDSFVREAEVWTELDDHDNVVDVLDWGERPVPWIALEYMSDGNLRSRVGDVRPKTTVDIAGTVADALWYAHRNGVTHTDVKPENVLFGREDGRRTVKVADWGSANVRLEPDAPDGLTPAYAAPEQVEPDRFGEPDDLTDVYQLGVLVYELFTGHTPFERDRPEETLLAVVEEPAPPPSAHDDRIPAAVDDALSRALATEKDERYDSVVHFRERLESLVADE